MPKYTSTDAFIQAVLKDYYAKEAHTSRGKLNFLILLFASGEVFPTLKSYFKDVSLEKKLLSSAVSLVALRFLLGRVLSGPLGVLISAASIGSLTMLAYNNREKIAQTMGDFRKKIALLKQNYEEIVSKYESGAILEQDFDLMVDGLKARFFSEIH